MRKTGCTLYLVMLAFLSFSQSDSILPVYLRFPQIPQFTIYNAPDSTRFTRESLKKKPVLFVIFDPFCDHCQHETKAITENINRFKGVQLVMVNYTGYGDMLQFYRDYKIPDFPNITMGFDAAMFFPSFFRVRNLPAIFLYDKKWKFKAAFEGSVSIDKIAAAL